MPANSLLTGSIVKLKEDVTDQIKNFSPSDAPLVSMLGDRDVSAVYKEWQRDNFRTPNAANAAIEGADATYAAQGQPTLLNNRTQIFQDTFSVSNTSEVVGKYGRKSEIKRLTAKKAIEIKRDKEAAYLSSPATVTGTSGVAARTRGLFGFLTQGSVGATGAAPDPTTNTAPVNGTDRAIDETIWKAGLALAYTNGGDGAVALVSPAHKQKISTFTGNVQRTSEVGSKVQVTLNTSYDFYKSDFGVTKVVPNRVQSAVAQGLNDTIYIVDPDKLGDGILRNYEREQLATVGDAKNYQVRTETMLIVDDEKPLVAIRDITATGN